MRKSCHVLIIALLALAATGFPQEAPQDQPASLDEESSRQSSPPVLTRQQMETIKSAMRSILSVGDRIAQAMRLSFHDCVGAGKCNGCLNTNHSFNVGPMAVLKGLLDNLYDSRNFRQFLSRADFYALGGIVAMEIGVENNNAACNRDGGEDEGDDRQDYQSARPRPIRLPQIDFYYGRVDCPTSPTTTVLDPFPLGQFNHTQVLDFYASTFGLNVCEAVALNGGGHTLGGAHAEASGYLGKWKGTLDESKRFNNKYFQLLLDRSIDYRQINVQPTTGATTARWQWDGYQRGAKFNFMLPSDVSLAFRIRTDSVGMSQCAPPSTCGAPFEDQSASYVQKFADDVDEFLQVFVRAYTKMVNTVADPGRLRRVI